jgi:cytidine deaminase
MSAKSPADCIGDGVSHSPLAASRTLLGWTTHKDFAGAFPPALVDEIVRELGVGLPDLMLSLLPIAACLADAPISQYSAACVARGLSGGLYFGANTELRHLPLNLTIHAEQTATINAWEHGESGLSHLAISATPCGHCRQFLYEIEGVDRLVLALPDRSAYTLQALLPRAFGPQDLEIEASFMASEDQNLELAADSIGDAVVRSTLAAARSSYAPYSGSYSAVGLVAGDGSMTTGRYVENAAYNPAVPPVIAALAMLRLRGSAPADLVRAVLVERPALVGHEAFTRFVLKQLVGIDLEVYAAKAVPS